MLIVERIINNTVILETDDLTHLKEDISKFAYNVKAGDVVIFLNNHYIFDEENTIKRKKIIENISKNIFNK